MTTATTHHLFTMNSTIRAWCRAVACVLMLQFGSSGMAAHAPLPPGMQTPRFRLEHPSYYFADPEARALLAAALVGDLAAAQASVARGASPNSEGPADNPYNRIGLLHYAIAADSAKGVRTLMAVGADPEFVILGSAGRALLFAETLGKPDMLALMLDLKPVSELKVENQRYMLSHALMQNQPRCLQVALDKGVPIDIPDEIGGTIVGTAMDTQDYAMAKWLIERGASVLTDSHDLSFAWTVQYHLNKWKPGSPPWKQVSEIQQMAIERGAVFPATSPKERRAARKAEAAAAAASVLN